MPALNQKMFFSSSGSHSVAKKSDSLRPRGLHSPWNSLGQNTGVGSLSLLQGIFPTQGSEPKSPTLQVDSLPVEPRSDMDSELLLKIKWKIH